MGLFKNIQRRIDKRTDARLARKQSRVDSKNRARENRVALKYAPQVEKAIENIETTAAENNTTPEEVSQNIIKNPTIQKQYTSYLNRKGKGLTPNATPEAVAVQTYDVYTQDVENRRNEAMQDAQNSTNEDADTMEDDYSYEEAEDALIGEEFLGREAANFTGSEDPDNFLSVAAIGALSKGAPVLIDAVNKKRIAAGKKPLPTIDEIINKTGTGEPSAIKKATDAAQEEYIAQKKKEEIKKMIPQIIGGVLLLVIITVAITYYSRSHS